MKKNSLFLLALIGVLTLGSCKKSDDAYSCATCATTPRAASTYDASSGGVYIGVLIGSSGTIRFNIMNNGTDINAVMVIDGITVNLTSSVTWVSGQPYIAPFTGTLNGSPVSITFSVNNIGGSPTITTASVPGHPSIEFTLAKETSTALVEGFEGTYSTSQSKKGTFNILLSRVLGKWGGVAKEDGSSGVDDINGTIVNGKLIDDSNTQVGTLSGDEISGTFVDGNNTTITISGKRTL